MEKNEGRISGFQAQYVREEKFYEDLTRMTTFNYITKVQATSKWAEETGNDIMETKINPTEFCNKEVFRIKVDKFKVVQEKLSKKTTSTQ